MISASSNFKAAQSNIGTIPTYYAVGDIHGRLDLLNALLEKIFKDAQDKDWRLVFLGDYVDRGPHSKGVIQRLIDLQKKYGEKVICLRGNHESILYSALKPNTSLSKIKFYMSENCGLPETIRSYSVMVDDKGNNYNLSKILKDFRSAVPAEHVKFLDSLKNSLETEHAFFSHAGVNPNLPFDKQDYQSLLWGHNDMLLRSGKYDKLVVHGHYAYRDLKICHQRISIDTRAYRSGVLTCCVIGPDGNYRFLDTAPEPVPKPSNTAPSP